MSPLSNILAAAHFASRKHHGQFRKGEEPEPYVVHPIEVAHMLSRIGGVEDPDIIAAALLHDTIEDTDATEADLNERFGERVTSIVLEVTDDTSLPKHVRKEKQVEHAPHMSIEAKMVKMCDKISNISDILVNPPKDWDYERKLDYVEWGERVFIGLRGANTKLEEHFDELIRNAKSALSEE